MLTFGLISGALRITVGRGFGVGLLIRLVSCVCSIVTFQIVYFKVTPQFGDKFAACMVERARASGASQQKIDETAKQAQTLKQLYDDPLTNAALTFVQPFPIGPGRQRDFGGDPAEALTPGGVANSG